MSPDPSSPMPPPARLRDIALAAVAHACGTTASGGEGEALRRVAGAVATGGRSLQQAVEQSQRTPRVEDTALVWLAGQLSLSPLELLAVALAAAVEEDTLVGRLLAHAQAPVGGARPTAGLIGSAVARACGLDPVVLPALLNGRAVSTGLLAVVADQAPVPERQLLVPIPLVLALAGYDGAWPGATVGLDTMSAVPLPATTLQQAARQADALRARPPRALVLRTGSPAEGRSVAQALAVSLDCRPVFIETEKVSGIGPWLQLRRLLPVFCLELAPGERRRLPELPGYAGPVLVVAGPDGSVDIPHATTASWTLPVPPSDARRALWRAALRVGGDGEGTRQADRLAERLAQGHRHGAGRIAHLGRLAQHHAALAGRAAPEHDDVLAAAWTAEGSGLDTLAEPLRTRVADDALVVSPALDADLRALMQRCLAREELVNGLGESARTRYQPGVRALFTGPSGTGKTLAAGWIATRLGMPLYRVDLAAVTSKYIGETEKNLSQLLARAEQAEVMLLFDEADALFGKRTEVSDANDRFANAQTNYLLQRIEHYDGIVLLTSNSQARFDQAFARRLDFVIDFPTPGPEERRAIWQSHLGPDTRLKPEDINRIAVMLDISGGHIRNAVLAAAVQARAQKHEIGYGDLLAGLQIELRKLGRQVPIELRASGRS